MIALAQQSNIIDEVIHGEALAVLRTLPDNSVDAIVCDPPAGISFMGKDWDNYSGKQPTRDSVKARNAANRGPGGGNGNQPFGYSPDSGRSKTERDAFISFLTVVMAEALRVLKPGGHAFVWSLPRTSHWTGIALEDAGFEIRDVVTHLFGCLSEDTEILTEHGWEQYHKCVVNNLALCYNVNTQAFGWEPIKEVLTYDYNDTAFRIHSDNTDQLVSRNHRCIVERSGSQVFQYAETLQSEESVPILEDLPALLEALPLPYERASGTKQGMFKGMLKHSDREGQHRTTQTRPRLSSMQQTIQAKEQSVSEQIAVLLSQVLRRMESHQSRNTGTSQEHRQQGQRGMDTQRARVSQAAYDGCQQSSLEGRHNLLQDTRQLYRREVYPVSSGISTNGTQGWLCDGTPLVSGASDRAALAEKRSSTSQRSQSWEQRSNEPTTLCEQFRPQTIRASRFTSTDLATVTPVHYQGVVWCIRVPSGAFVARRNGKVFITGNSGFPKSHDISAAIDKMHGAEREVIGEGPYSSRRPQRETKAVNAYHDGVGDYNSSIITAPATPEASQWNGWGTALKPASEHWWLCRKPLSEPTIAANVLKWGTGAINIDATRVGGNVPQVTQGASSRIYGNGKGFAPEGYQLSQPHEQGRWPANLLLSHSVWCVPNGVKRVRGSHDNGYPIPRNSTEIGFTRNGSGCEPMKGYTDSEGMEQVEDWLCDESCPIRLLDEQSGIRKNGGQNSTSGQKQHSMFGNNAVSPTRWAGDQGGASRYFQRFYPFIYQAKASRAERNRGIVTKVDDALVPDFEEGLSEGYVRNNVTTHNGTGNYRGIDKKPLSIAANTHPTVKPVQLMRYLVRMITPPGGIVLDCFAGSGSTLVAAIHEGMHFIGIEMNDSEQEPYITIARARIEQAFREVQS